MEGINVLIISGTLERDPAIRWREDGMCVCTGSVRMDPVYKIFMPFEAYGKTGEAMGECHMGDGVLLQGKIFWRKYVTKSGEEKSGPAILVNKGSLLVPASVADRVAS
jgi:single-stranded DNA-binding protein